MYQTDVKKVPTTKFSYNQPSYTDDANNPWNLVPTYKSISSNGAVEGSLIETPDDNTNMFSVFTTSILAVYFMLTGDTSVVSSWELTNNWTLSILLVLFSFFTTIYLLNLFIGLLSMAIEQTNNEESFLKLKGEKIKSTENEDYPPHSSSAILEITQFDDSQIGEILKAQVTLKTQMDEMKNHINEALKNQNE
ncbi:10535_t:CDS:2, partial [Racocetra persica]